MEEESLECLCDDHQEGMDEDEDLLYSRQVRMKTLFCPIDIEKYLKQNLEILEDQKTSIEQMLRIWYYLYL
jgi:hypothetical protein